MNCPFSSRIIFFMASCHYCIHLSPSHSDIISLKASGRICTYRSLELLVFLKLFHTQAPRFTLSSFLCHPSLLKNTFQMQFKGSGSVFWILTLRVQLKVVAGRTHKHASPAARFRWSSWAACSVFDWGGCGMLKTHANLETEQSDTKVKEQDKWGVNNSSNSLTRNVRN